VASAGKDGTVRLWDVDSGQTRAIFKRLSAGVHSLAFTADGQSLASAGADHLVRIWDVATGQERALLKGHTQAVHAVAIAGDVGALASAGADGTVRLWDLARGPERAAFKWHTDVVRAVAFSPDGKTLASASDDKTVRLWDVNTGQERAVLKGHARPVAFVAFSADGKLLLTKDLGNIASVWDAATGHLRADAPLPDVAPPAAVSPDGRWQARIDRNIVHLLERRWTKPLLPPRPRPGTPDPAWHADQAVRAEKDKQFYAAGFHLGKLADARPWDAQTRWHEALAWAHAQQPTRATLAFVRAVLLDPRVTQR
jgi:WD40 repeat protein